MKLLNHYKNEVKSKFQNLNINENLRKKRGLINGLGSVIKSITGNLDAQDAEYYDKLIDELKNNQQTIQKNLMQNYNYNNELVKQFNDTINSLKHNQLLLTSRILQIQNYTQEHSTLIDSLFLKDIINQITLYYNSLLIALNNIEISLSFCNLNYFHETIITYP